MTRDEYWRLSTEDQFNMERLVDWENAALARLEDENDG